MKEAVGCSLLLRSCRAVGRSGILPWSPYSRSSRSRVDDIGVSYANVCRNMAQRSVELEDLVMRRRRHWHRLCDVLVTLLVCSCGGRREVPAAPHLTPARGSRDRSMSTVPMRCCEFFVFPLEWLQRVGLTTGPQSRAIQSHAQLHVSDARTNGYSC